MEERRRARGMTQRKLDLPSPSVEAPPERPEPSGPTPPAAPPAAVERTVSAEPALSREPSDRALRERQRAWLRERARFRSPDADPAPPPQDK